MSDKDNGGPAFPVVADRGMRLENSEGISVRDYFAANALSALIIAKSPFEIQKYSNTFAESAYSMADAMLEARQS